MNCREFVSVFLISSFLLSTVNNVNAQGRASDVVYLKNGSVIKGSVLEMIPEETIRIQTSDGSILVFNMADVEKTEKNAPVKVHGATLAGGLPTPDKAAAGPARYFIVVRLGPVINGLEIISSDNEALGISGGIINGFYINKNISIGLGVETNYYSFTQEQNSSIRTYPIFIDTRFYVGNKTAQPMFNFQFGYAPAGDAKVEIRNSGLYNAFIPKSGKGGAFLSTGFGIKIKATNNVSFMMDGGFSFQSLKGTRTDYISPVMQTPATATIASLRMNFGVAFNFSPRKT